MQRQELEDKGIRFIGDKTQDQLDWEASQKVDADGNGTKRKRASTKPKPNFDTGMNDVSSSGGDDASEADDVKKPAVKRKKKILQNKGETIDVSMFVLPNLI
jgi:hypothetical protein